VRGIHTSPEKTSQDPKPVVRIVTFNENLSSEIFMLERLAHIAKELETDIEKQNF